MHQPAFLRFVLLLTALFILLQNTRAQQGSTLDFDGQNDYVTVPHSPSLFFSDAISVEARVYFRAGGDRRIVDKTTAGISSDGPIMLDTWQDRFRVIISTDAGEAIFQSNATLNLNTTYYLAVVYSNSNGAVSLFINGALDRSVPLTGNLTNSSLPLNIGAPGSGSSNNGTFNGRMDELRVWKRALTICEVQGRSACTVEGPAPGLVANYRFNQGIAGGNNSGINQLTDLSGQQNNGQLMNFALSGNSSNWMGNDLTGVLSVCNGSSNAVSTPPVLYVNATAAGKNDGSSWTNAYTSLSDALLHARNLPGSCGAPVIRLAKGIYLPSRDATGNLNPADPRDKTFYNSVMLTLEGGYEGSGNQPDLRLPGNNSILSGNTGLSNSEADNVYHVFINEVQNTAGIGDQRSLQISRVIIQDGRADSSKSVLMPGGSSVAANQGGGFINLGPLTAEHLVITGNHAQTGAGLFDGNNTGASSVIRNSLFHNNHADARGGAVATNGIRILQCNNITFYGNAAGGDSGSVYHKAGSGGLIFTNCIYAGNHGRYYSSVNGTATNRYTLTDSAGISGTSVSTGNPGFYNAANPAGPDGLWMTSDDGLQANACAAIDKGLAIGITGSEDLAGKPRVVDANWVAGPAQTTNQIDLGAYEAASADTLAFGGTIGNPHTVPSPQQFRGDSLSSLNTGPVPSGTDIVFSWKKSTSISGPFSAADSVTNRSVYPLPNILLDAAENRKDWYYRRTTNVCGFEFNSNVVRLTVVRPQGRINGFITSRNNAPVQGVTVYAQKTTSLPGSPATYRDSTITNNSGYYDFSNLYYGDPNTEAVTYSIRPFKPLRNFDPDTTTRLLSGIPALHSNVNFKDTSSLSIYGQVIQVCTDCVNALGTAMPEVRAPLDSVSIFRNNGPGDNTFQFYTKTGTLGGVQGRYSLDVVDPVTYTVKPGFGSHQFVPATRSANLVQRSFVDSVDFVDTTTRRISGYLRAGCRDFIGQAVIEFSDVLPNAPDNTPRPSVFYKRVTTTLDSGFFSIRLPARKYRAKIVGFRPAYPVSSPFYVDSLTVVNFFSQPAVADSLIRDITERDTTLNLTYQRPPSILVSGLNKVCTNGEGYAVLPQLQSDSVRITVYEGTQAMGCPVTRISNTRSDSLMISTNVPFDDIRQDLKAPLGNGSEWRTAIRGGTPRIDAPYLKDFDLLYTDRYNRTATFQRKVLVTGVKSDPGSFSTVSPQIPLLILHDPPGDASYATWESSVSNETAMRMFVAKNASANVWTEVKIGTEFSAGIGYELTTSIWASANAGLNISSRNSSNSEAIVSTTSTATYTTSDQPGAVGDDADLFIGTAINLLYAAATEISYAGTCDVRSSRTITVAPDSFSTRYVYSQDFIKNNLIPELLDNAAISTDSAQAARFRNQARVWQQALDNNEANKRLAVLDQNYSFNGGGSGTTITTTTSSTQSNTLEFNLEIEESLAVQLGLDIGGSGISGGATVAFKLETGNSTTNTSTRTLTTSYLLKDNTPGDVFTVDVKKDPVYNTAVFVTRAGSSSCPPEPFTQPRDAINLTVDRAVISGLSADSTAIFNFSVGNVSTRQESRSYVFGVDAGENSSGADIRLNNFQLLEIPVQNVQSGQSKPVMVTVKKGPGNTFSYEGLKFYARDNCDGSVMKVQPVSVFFNSPCSPIKLLQPLDGWVCNRNNQHRIPVTFTGYNLNSLTAVSLEFAKAGSSDWQTAFTLQNDGVQIRNSADGTTVIWNVEQLPDSVYQMRLKLACAGGIVYSERVIGTIDRRAPQRFGKPDPTDDQYSTGDLIGISFDEAIANSNLGSNKVTVKRVSNGSIIPAQLSGYDNRLLIVPEVNLMDFAGDSIQVTVQQISDRYGNLIASPETFRFRIGGVTPPTNLPAATLQVRNALISENSSSPITVTVKLSSPATFSLPVNFSLAGNGIPQQDYRLGFFPNSADSIYLSGARGTVYINAGSDSAQIRLFPVNNNEHGPTKNITVSLAPGGNYSFGSIYQVQGSIIEDDAPVTYVFTGNGPFSDAANWLDGRVPPRVLQTGNEILINPAGNGQCTMNVPLYLLPGARLTVADGKKLLLIGNLDVNNL